MLSYRIYCIDSENRIKRANVVECDGDAAAGSEATALLGGCRHSAAEVWQGERLVCRIDRRDEAVACGCGGASPGCGAAPV
jgi:hypothetical protein